jgi:poly(A) polymerase
MKRIYATEIVKRLRDKGFEAYFVGGCVRDMEMGIEPADYDIATSARPEEVIGLFPRTEPIGAQFGVVLVIYQGVPFEVATFRSDEAYVDGRRPSGVVFTSYKEDVQRRDFTINGMLFDPIEGRLVDEVCGKADIAARIVRAIGDPIKRFGEDKLRLLRAIRFGARLGYTIEEKTWQAVRVMAPEIHQVSSERIRDELVRILIEGQAARGVGMLSDAGLLRKILPEVTWSDELERALDLMRPDPKPDFAMGVLLSGTTEHEAADVVSRLHFSNVERAHIVALVREQETFTEIQQMSVAGQKRFFRVHRFDDHLELHRLLSEASGSNLTAYGFVQKRCATWSEDDLRPRPLISGEDLITLGLVPGPLFKRILNVVEDEQLEGILGDREAALCLVRERFMGEGS